MTPIFLTNVTAGIHTVKLELFHYKDKIDNVVIVKDGETTYLDWELIYAPAKTYKVSYKDDYVNISDDGNTWTCCQLEVGRKYTVNCRAYLRFKLDHVSLPERAIVTGAKFTLYKNYFSMGVTIKIGLY